MTDDAFQRGDVVWAPDPFRSGTNPRPRLILVADALPSPGEAYVCVALTTGAAPLSASASIGDCVRDVRDPFPRVPEFETRRSGVRWTHPVPSDT